MRVLVIGCGSIGARHVRNLRQLGVQVDAWDINRAALDAIQPELGGHEDGAGHTAVLICTPADTHGFMARRLLAEGYRGPLFVEKPLVTTLADAEIFRTWPHPVQMVGYNWRFHSDVEACRAFLESGSAVEFRCNTDMRTWPGASRDGDPWLECSHEVDLALSWLGPATEFSAVDGDDQHALHLRHTRGSSTIVVNSAVTMPSRTIEIWNDGRDVKAMLGLDAQLDRSYVREMEIFLRCVREQLEPSCTFKDGLAVVELIEQARKAAA